MTACASSLHPDYAYIGEDGVEQAGPDAAVAVAELYTTAFPDLRFEEVRASHAPSPDVAIIELVAPAPTPARSTTSPRPGGSPRSSRATSSRPRRQDLREQEFFDTHSLMQQLGLADG